MENNKGQAVIDTDFFIKFTEKDSTGQLFLKIMDEMGFNPVIHNYVFKEELLGNSIAKKLVESDHIKILDYNDYINPSNQSDYEVKFIRLYRDFNSQDFEGDIYTYRHEKESLGEIRSSLMAWYLGINILMSDDGGAKYYITSRLGSRRHRIEVYNVYDTLKLIGQKEVRNLKWSDIKATAKAVFENAENKYNDINETWHH